ncbi:DegQ family serine endoprotease [Noviherbaspirillum sp. 1P10PC]|uniref:DegQ family serine endoprotease n=1 Tax=Noviherbaspirillum sp. 1P10PC TaxID=3132292 RepID=UPI0039A03437
MKLRQATAALTVAGVLVTSAAGAAGWSPKEWFSRQESTQSGAAATAAAPAPAPVAPATAPNYRAIVDRFGPAVVGINTEGTMKTAARGDNDDDPFSQFFRGVPGRGGQAPVPVRGQGSGFIVGQDGIILTNAHVVKDASEVTVKLSDRREFKARVLGSDPATDVAVLKIDATKLPVVTLGDPKRLGVGDYVLAIGSPFGFEQSATSGIVSAKGRSLPGDAYVPFIQTDVAVNPGNSGGPLFDASGAVVGINSQIYSQTGGYMGLSFAIPIDVALSVKDQIVATGRVSHARLGVAVQELNQTLADSFKLPQPEGALVSSIDRNSPAAKAGLQPGDVILSYNGQAIARSGDLPAQVGLAKPGDQAKMEVWRNGRKETLTATLAGSSDKLAAAAPASASRGKLGVAVRPLTDEERQEAHLRGGLVVEQAGGAAARSGVEPGDIIVAINGTPVASVPELQKRLEQAGGQAALLVQRGETQIFVPVKLG